MRMRRHAFSLVEMLIAVLLLSMLISLAVLAFKYQAMAIYKTEKVGINKVLKYNQLRSVLESISFYIVDTYDIIHQPTQHFHPYFKGDSKTLSFITTNPLFSNDISLGKFSCRENKLSYKEEHLFDRMDYLSPKFTNNVNQLVFYKKLDNCSFQYLYNMKLYDVVTDKIPDAIIIHLKEKKHEQNYFFNVKSDYNQSVSNIYDVFSRY